MNVSRFLTKTMSTLALVGLVLATYVLWARPHQLRWGATDAEVNRAMPGDELDPAPTFLATRAITIDGTPQDIWPWLIQMGYERAGYYGYDILENLGSTRGLASADSILPEFQRFKVGDDVPISSVARMSFRAIEPNQYLIWSGEEAIAPGGFTWALYPLDAQHTRLVSRIRWSHHWTKPDLLALDLFTDVTDHLAVRKILQGVKGRVEGRIEPMAQGNTEFVIYLVSAVIFLGAVVVILLRPLTWYRWLAGLAAGAAWLVTWYTPVSLWFGAALELLVLLVLVSAAQKRSAGRRRPRQAPSERPARPISLRWLLGCLAFLGVSAAFGGIVLTLNPTGSWLQIPLSILQFSPFRDFLIPGLLLGIVFGIGSSATLLALWFRPAWPLGTALTRFTGAHWAWSAALAMGLGQVIWIATEMLMVRGADWLQFVYGGLGLLILLLSFQPSLRRYLAPGPARELGGGAR